MISHSRWHVTPSPPGTHFWALDFNKNCRKSLKSIVSADAKRSLILQLWEIGNLRGTRLIPSNNSQLVSKFGDCPKLGTAPQNARSFLSIVDNYSLLLIEHGYQLSENEGYTPHVHVIVFHNFFPSKSPNIQFLNPQFTRIFPIEMP